MRAPPPADHSARGDALSSFLKSGRSSQLVHILAVNYIEQVLSVLVLLHHFIDLEHILFADPAVQLGDFFKAANLSVLVLLHSLHEHCRVYKALVGSCVKPCESLAQELDIQLAFFQIDAVQVCDLIFAAG